MLSRTSDPSPRRIRVRRGLDLPLAGAPDLRAIEEGPPVRAVAVLGDDAPGVRADLRVEPGDKVRAGQTLFVDRRRPEIRFTAPGAGIVVAVQRGARRRIEAIVIRLEGEEEERFEVPAGRAADAEEVRRLMLASGLWTALRTRPFSRIPDPDATPRALFVTAMASEPLAPPAEIVVRKRGEDFVRGLSALARMVEGPLFVCTRPEAGLPLPDDPRIREVGFEGPHPAGLPGTHVHRLAPASVQRPVWQLGYAEVLALGRLLATGRLPTERVVALCGPCVEGPRLVRTRLGASTEDLIAAVARECPCRVLSGSVLSGRQAAGHGAFLGRLHDQVTVLSEDPDPLRRSWLRPARRGVARAVLGGDARPSTTSLACRRGPFFPLERLERVWPFDLPLAPLLRALVVGDAEAAAELGALELAEEDLALVAFLCPGKIEYGPLLRAVLDELERQQP